MSYLGVEPGSRSVRTSTVHTASAGQNTFNVTGGYMKGFVDVFVNGTKTLNFSATDNQSIVLSSNANLNDKVEIIAYAPLAIYSVVNKSGDAMGGDLTLPNLIATANVGGANGYFNNLKVNQNTYINNSLTVIGNTSHTGNMNITGNLNLSGSLTITGEATSVTTQSLAVEDSIITMAANNTAGDTLDIGFAGKYNDGSANVWTGLVRNATDKEYYFFQGYDTTPGNDIDITDLSFQIANVHANFSGNLQSNNITVVQLNATNLNMTSSITLTGDASGYKQNSTTVYGGDAGAGFGRIEYYANKWVFNAGSDSSNVVHFQRGNLLKSWIDNDGNFSATANNANNLGGVAPANYLQTSGSYTISGTRTHTANIEVRSANLIINTSASIMANGTVGAAGQVLTSNGSTIYWSYAGVNTAAQYTWSNSHTFQSAVTFGNSTVNSTINSTALVTSSITGNLTGNVVATTISGNLTGNVVATTISGNLTGNVIATTISGNLTGNVAATTVSATTLSGNLTGNVAAVTISGNLTGNVAAVTISGNLTGNVAATTITGNLTGNVVAGTVNSTTINATSSIVVGANVSINTSTLSVGNSTANVYVNSTAFVGNVVATSVSGNLTGNVVATTISGNLTGNVVATTISGNLTAVTANVTNKLQVGTPGSFDFGSNAVIEIDANGNTYVQVVVQNANTGNNASADLVVTNDQGNDSVGFVDLGINGSNYNQPGFNVTGAGDAYLYASNGALAIGTASAKEVIFHANGTTSSDRRFTINATALTIANAAALVANGTSGTNGQILTTNSTGVYWSSSANNALNLGGVAAASYQLNSTLNANIASYLPIYTGTVNASLFQVGSSFTANSSQVVAADVLVTGNLVVNGTMVTLNTATLDVKDLNITVAKGAASAAAANGAGLTVDVAGATLTYLNASNTWLSNINLGVGNTSSNVTVNSTAFIGNVVATSVSGNLTGNVAATTITGNLTGNVAATTITGNLTGNVTSVVTTATTNVIVGNSTVFVYSNTTAHVGNVVASTVSGNLTGNVVATTISGNLTGNVAAVTITGNLTGNVAATTISGNLTGNVTSVIMTATTNAVVGNSTIRVFANTTAFVGNVVATTVSGNLTGNVAATTISGNLTGNVVATTISGNLTGNVAAVTITGNLTGNVAATTISGNLTGNVAATTISGNLTGNVVATNVNAATIQVSTSITLDNDKNLQWKAVNTSTVVGMRQQSDDNFVFYTTDANNAARPVFAIYANSSTSNLQMLVPLNLQSSLGANGSFGSPGQALTSTGSGVYWSTITTPVNTAAQYAWSNTHTFSANVSFTGNGIGLATNTGAIYLGGIGDLNWKIGRNTGVTTKWKYTNNTIDIITANSNLEGMTIGLVNGNSYFETGYLGTFISSNATVGNSTSNVTINSTSFVGNVVATSISGNLTGNVAATTITGNLTGNVAAVTITGNLTGNVAAVTITGNLTGNVAATTISGNLTGNVVAGTVNATTINATSSIIVGANLTVNTSALVIGNGTYVAAPQIRLTNTAGATVINAGTISTTSLFGNLTGNVAAVTISGNLTGNVAAVTITGNLTGNVTSTLVTSGNGYFTGNVGVGVLPNSTVGLYVSKIHQPDVATYGSLTASTDSNAALTAAASKVGIGSLFYNSSQNKSSDGLTLYNTNYLGHQTVVYNGANGVDARANLMEGVRGQVLQLSNGTNANTITTARGLYGIVQTFGSGVITQTIGIQSDTSAGNNSITGNIGTAFGVYSTVTSNTAMTIGTGYLYYGAHSGSTTTTKYGMYLANEQYNYFSGNVGIGNTTPAFKLRVDGTTSLAGAVQDITTLAAGNSTISGFINASSTVTAVDFNSTSDIRYKKDIVKIENALDKVNAISGYTFTMTETDERSTGLIAQEVEKVLPEAVKGEDKKTLSYGNMIGLLVEAIKEQNKKIEELERLINNK